MTSPCIEVSSLPDWHRGGHLFGWELADPHKKHIKKNAKNGKNGLKNILSFFMTILKQDNFSLIS
jgi:hypothetical protein